MSTGLRRQPLRTCVGCGAKKPQRAMLRIAAGLDGEPGVDVQYCAAGRGAYLCRTQVCLERAFTRRALERALKLKNSVGAGLKADLEKQLILDKEFSGTQGKA